MNARQEESYLPNNFSFLREKELASILQKEAKTVYSTVILRSCIEYRCPLDAEEKEVMKNKERKYKKNYVELTS